MIWGINKSLQRTISQLEVESKVQEAIENRRRRNEGGLTHADEQRIS